MRGFAISPLAEGFDPQLLKESLDRFNAALSVCEKRLKWKRADVGYIALMSRAAIGVNVSRAEIARLDFNVAAIEGWFDSESDRFKTTFGRYEVPQKELDEMTASMVTKLAQRGVSVEQIKLHQQKFVEFLAAKVSLERARRRLSMM